MYYITAYIPNPTRVGSLPTPAKVESYVINMFRYSWCTHIKVKGPDCTFVIRRKTKK